MSDSVYIRLVNPAWAGHNGYFGQVPFENGLSTRPVTRHEADLISALTRTETETGEAVGMAHRLIDGATIPAPILEPLARQSEDEKDAEAKKDAKAAGAETPDEAVLKVYTAEELQAVADKDGISGLRVIAKPLGVKGRAITELLSEIVREQEQRFGKTPQEASPSADAPEGAQPPTIDPLNLPVVDAVGFVEEPADAEKESFEAGEGAEGEKALETPAGTDAEGENA